MQKAQPEIFFSYAWGGESEPYALALYESLKKAGYKGIMDRYAVDYKKSFTEFMKRIGRGSFIIVLVNDKYLKSDFCMFEFLEIFRKSSSELNEMDAKLFPIVFNDAKLRDFKDALAYANFWKEQANDLDAALTDIGRRYTTGWNDIYKVFDEIGTNIGDFAKWLRGHNTLTPDKLAENDFAIIKQAIKEREKLLTQEAPDGLPHHLTAPPFRPEVFIGREDELAEVHKQLFEGDNLLLLVNGMGGVGKTTLATRYYHSYANEYAHLAWVLSEKNIANALLLLAVPLGLSFEDTMPTEARLQVLLAKMANLSRPCLLVIDNANELEDLQANYMALRSCPNFHLLLTTRIAQFEKAATFKVGALPYDTALELFTEHYNGHNAAEDALFKEVYEAVDGNTLVIELLAKNLNVQNLIRRHYSLGELVADLQKGLLSISKTKPVSIHYHSNTLLKGEPQDIIAAMYDISELSAAERRLLSNFAVLPAENIFFVVLESLLPATPQLEENLVSLSLKGWIEYNQLDSAFKISPVVQEIVLLKNGDLLEDTTHLIACLIDKLKYEGGHIIGSSYKEAFLFARYAETVVSKGRDINFLFATLCERLGSFFQITGNLPIALRYYLLYNEYTASLCLNYPGDADYVYGLAISYLKLGEICTSLGNLQNAEGFFTEYYNLAKQLFENNPANISFKNGLAISLLKIGEVNASLGNLQKAVRFYLDYKDIMQQLLNAFSDNLSFEVGLAISYQKIGQFYEDMGNLHEALKFYMDYRKRMKQLFEAHPNNVTFKNGLAISYAKLGQIYTMMNNLNEAIRFFSDSNVLIQQLTVNDPNNIGLANELAISYSKLGQTYASMGNLEVAIGFYKEENHLFEKLFAAHPYHVALKNGLAVSYSKLGEAYDLLGDIKEALRLYYDCMALMQQLSEAYPDNVAFKNGLAISYAKLGRFYKNDDAHKARQYFEQAQKLWIELVETAPQYAEFNKYLTVVQQDLADLEGK